LLQLQQVSLISFCKIRAKDTKHAKDVIFMIDDIEGVYRTETMISLKKVSTTKSVWCILSLKTCNYLNAIF
jgi:DNA-binding Lrp family transcriptional regulator